MTTELPTLSSVPSDPKWYAREALRIAGPNLESVCKALGVRVIYEAFDPDELKTPAFIASEHGGFVAIVAQCVLEDDPLRARKCVAHEAAHALFWDRSGEGVPPRAAAWPPTPEEEKFCNEFAVELLALEDAEEITRRQIQTTSHQTLARQGGAEVTKRKPNKKKTVKSSKKTKGSKTSRPRTIEDRIQDAAVDVTPADLIDGGRRIPFLRDILDEIDRQWPQGRDPSGNGHGQRIGTLYLYFDPNDCLHMHFAERGSYLQRKGPLKRIPKCVAPSYIFHTERGK